MERVSQDGPFVSGGAGTDHGAWAVLSTLLAKNHFPDRSGFLTVKLCEVRNLATTEHTNGNFLVKPFVLVL